MELLTGANISVRYDEERKLFIAFCGVGFTSKECSSKDLVSAVGMAVILQAGMTEKGLKKKLEGKR